MKAIKRTIAMVSLVAVLGAVNAQALGKQEQNILVGAAVAALVLPALVLSSTTTTHYVEPARHDKQNVRYVEPARHAQPVKHVEPAKHNPPKVVANNNNNQARVVIRNNDNQRRGR